MAHPPEEGLEKAKGLCPQQANNLPLSGNKNQYHQQRDRASKVNLQPLDSNLKDSLGKGFNHHLVRDKSADLCLVNKEVQDNHWLLPNENLKKN